MKILVKDGVIIREINQPFISLCKAIDEVWIYDGRDPVITSANDSKHMAKSLHYKNLAWDLRTRNLSIEETKEFAINLEEELELRPGESQYDVIVEKDHIHVEFDS